MLIFFPTMKMHLFPFFSYLFTLREAEKTSKESTQGKSIKQMENRNKRIKKKGKF
jgi:hypothetical protein